MTEQQSLPLQGGIMAEPATALAVHEVTPMTLIDRAVELGRDPKDLTKLFNLQERHERNRAAEAFSIAMTEFQGRCPIIHKSREAKGTGSFAGYSFASYDDIMRAVGPILKDCGIAVSFSTEQIDKQLKITCRLRHGIHFEDHTLTVPVPDMRVNDTQKYGAALSYAKRYALSAALNIVVSDEDDDGATLEFVPISDEQYASLHELLEASGADLKRFLACYQIEKLGELPRAKFEDALAALKRKMASKR